MRKVLVFAPHPDDDVIGCGGSILKHVRKGNTVGVIYITSGDSGSLIYSSQELRAIREAEAQASAKLLGISEVLFFGNSDGFLQYDRENVIKIIKIIREWKPDLVYTPHEHDSHRDHRVTFDLVSEACQQAGSPVLTECGQELWTVGNILAYEVGTPLPQVNYVEDISVEIEMKIQAMLLHESQIMNIAYDEAARTLNRLRGITTGQGVYCECFQILKASELF